MGRAFPSAFLTNRSEEDLVGFAKVGVEGAVEDNVLEAILALEVANFFVELDVLVDVLGVACFNIDFVELAGAVCCVDP